VIGALISNSNAVSAIADGLFVGCCAVILWACVTLVI
jgi:hypothetical protein